jgi:hypothetical protein
MRVNAHFSFPYLRNIDRKQDANETYIPKERAPGDRRGEGLLRRGSREKRPHQAQSVKKKPYPERRNTIAGEEGCAAKALSAAAFFLPAKAA